MTAVVDRVACPECGAQKGRRCWRQLDPDCYSVATTVLEPHDARREALWALNRRETANVNDRSTP